uniref:CD209 antigen-like protein 2 n=1 Tax=Salarias fasciatus TaxID=181472 RepID=A0A672FV21_SALFA
NHSDVIMAEEDAKRALETAVINHAMLRDQLQQKKIINDGYQKQLEALRTERTTLLSNISALGETQLSLISSSYHERQETRSLLNPLTRSPLFLSESSCGKCPSGFLHFNTSCYFFSSSDDRADGRMSWQSGFWVGLTDIETEDQWVWINNVTEVEPRYWDEGEPNNHGPDGEDCALVIHRPSNPWKTRYDAKCKEHELYWLCEKSTRHNQ